MEVSQGYGNETPRMMGIREAAETGIMTEYAIRQLVKDGRIPCIKLKRKAYINYNKLVEMMNNL